jgi:hypothetical protein
VVVILWKSAFTQQMRTVKLLPESESCWFTLREHIKEIKEMG